MRRKHATQSLSYPIRLPDRVQADALRLLGASRSVINATVVALWDRLDEFGERESKYAYKQVTAMMGSPAFHGDRQWRCEAEQAGRILRGQAARKKHFALILPLLEQGMILPKAEKKPAGKNRKTIKQAIASLREEQSDGGSAVELQSLIEQACNFYLKHGCFPSSYEEMQAIPVLKVGILPYAGDDGGKIGQAYRLRIDLEGRCCYVAFRAPDQAGNWPASWTEPQMRLPLPDPVVERLKQGAMLAPTLREIAEPDGTRYAVLDCIVEVPVTELAERAQIHRVLGWDWGVRTLVTATVVDLDGNRLAPPLFLDSGGFDGRQAHTRRHIDRLKSKVAQVEARREQFPVGDQRREPSERKLAVLRREIACCWRKYEARNNAPFAPGGQHPALARHRVGSGPDLRRIPQVAQVGGPGTRSEGALGQLAHQCADSGSPLAMSALQMSPLGAAPGLAVSQRHDAHLPPLWRVCAYLCLTRSRRQKARCGSLAALF